MKVVIENKEDIEEIMKLTCYGSLAYCCGLEKNCPYRDMVLKLLGISKKEYLELKKSFHEQIITIILQRIMEKKEGGNERPIQKTNDNENRHI